MTLAHIRQAVFEHLCTLEDEYAVDYSLADSLLNPTDGLGQEVRPRIAAGANSATCTAADLINARPTNGACDVLRTGRNASATSQYADRSSCPGNSRRHSVASEKYFSPISPRRISAREHIRPAFVLSPKRTIPTIAVPAVATPTKLA